MTQSSESDYDRIFYPYLFEDGRVSVEQILAQVRHSTLEKSREVIALREETFNRNQQQIVAAGQAMAGAFVSGGTLFAFGNGGSATDAQDIVLDLVNPPHDDWQPFPALALNDDIATVTGVANDVGLDNVFSRQLIALAKPDDIAIGFSTSGNSGNVVAALRQAKKMKLLTIGLAGYDGGNMARLDDLDFCIIAPSEHIPRIQEAHATVYHALLHVVQEVCREIR